MLKIPAVIYDKMINHCKSELPDEACGILAGKDDTISEIYCMENIAKSPESFLMNPKEQLQVAKDLRKKNLKILAIFHSHPSTPAKPSEKDISMAFYEDLLYVIISLKDKEPVTRVFSIKNQNIKEVPYYTDTLNKM